MKKRGFTLIELLVVIAIIAILAAILFPVMTSAKKKAQQTQCSSNMKQVMSAVRMYCDDYNGGMPFCFHGAGTGTGDWSGCYAIGSWNLNNASLKPYIRNLRIFNCPSEPAAPCTYSMSAQYCSIRGATDSTSHRNLEVLTAGRATRLIVLFEEKNNNDSYCMWPDTSAEDFSIVHLEGGDYAFADGHVAYKTRAWLLDQRTKAKAGNRDTCFF